MRLIFFGSGYCSNFIIPLIGDDLEVRKITGKLYHLALLQFKNSYGKAKFNTKENDLLRKILYGFLVAKKENNALKNSDYEIRTT